MSTPTNILKPENCYFINIVHRRDRYDAVINEFRKQGIDPICWQVFPHNVPEIGCFQSHVAIIKHAKMAGKKAVTVFEDDVTFLHTNAKELITNCVKQLPDKWEVLYLCANTHTPLKQFSNNLFIADTVYNTAAIAYNIENIYDKYDCFKYAQEIPMPYDKLIAQTVQPNKKCYVAYPLICTQVNGYSDIAKAETDYYFIIERYKKFVKS